VGFTLLVVGGAGVCSYVYDPDAIHVVRWFDTSRGASNRRHSDDKLRIGLLRGGRKWPLNEAQRPQFRGVRVALLGTGYNPGEGNRWASRNGS
jgi:hypothetical protein